MNMTFFQRRQSSSQAEDDPLRHLSSSLGHTELEKEKKSQREQSEKERARGQRARKAM